MKSPVQSCCLPLYPARCASRFTDKHPLDVKWDAAKIPVAGDVVIGITNDGVICRIEFAKNRKPEAVVKEWQAAWPRTKFIRNAKTIRKVARDVFITGNKTGDATSLIVTGTAFQQDVWRTMLKIPAGKTLSYADVAKKIGRPKAVRAVGTACGANPIPLLIPCHRIVASNGTLGGFGGGLPLKIKLLKAENAMPKCKAG